MNASIRHSVLASNQWLMNAHSTHLDAAKCRQGAYLIGAGKPDGFVAILPSFPPNRGEAAFACSGTTTSTAFVGVRYHAAVTGKSVPASHALLAAGKGAVGSEAPDPEINDSEALGEELPEDERGNRVATVINPKFPLDAESASDDPEQSRETA